LQGELIFPFLLIPKKTVAQIQPPLVLLEPNVAYFYKYLAALNLRGKLRLDCNRLSIFQVISCFL